MADDLLIATRHALSEELDSALSRIEHCLSQLTDEQTWWRPLPDMNAIGNLVLHLAGNVEQLIVSVVGGKPDNRNRPAEFAARGSIPKAELLARLKTSVENARQTISGVQAVELCRVRRFRDSDWTGMQAIVRSVAHFRGHTQEIIHQTRTILGERYQFAGMK